MMVALDWMGSAVYEFCTSPHCNVLEEQSQKIYDKVLELQALDQQDEERLKEEQEICRVVHERLDRLKERAESILKNKDRAFQVLSKHEAEFLDRLEQVKNVFSLSVNLHIVQEQMSQLEALCEASLQKEAEV